MKKILLALSLAVFVFGCWEKKRTEAPKEKAEEKQEVAVSSWGYSDTPSANADFTKEPPLEVIGGFTQDIGLLLEGEKRVFTIKLKNTSEKPWKLQSIDADCACTNIDGIPGGVMLEPGKEWNMGVRIDAARIGYGDFEKHIMLEPLEFKRMTITVKGKIERFFKTNPSNKQMAFEVKGNPSASWENSIEVEGVETAKGKLKLALDSEQTSKYVAAELEDLGAGKWKIHVKSAKPLPYKENFSGKVSCKVLEPKGYPNVDVYACGKVGMSLVWKKSSARLKEELFEKGPVKLSFQLGVDPNNTSHNPSAKLLDAVEGIDWQKVYDTLEIRAPKGIEYTKTFTRLGVRLDVTVTLDAFKKGERLLRSIEIQSGCNGNWEASDIVIFLRRKSIETENDTNSTEEAK